MDDGSLSCIKQMINEANDLRDLLMDTVSDHKMPGYT